MRVPCMWPKAPANTYVYEGYCATMRHTDASSFVDPGRERGGMKRRHKPRHLQKRIMNCSQQKPEPRGALHNPREGAPQQKQQWKLTPQLATSNHRNRNHAPIGFKRHADPHRRLVPPALTHASSLSSGHIRATHAHPLHPAAPASVPSGVC